MKRSQFLGQILPGGYRIERFVASGGFAWVYEGRCPGRGTTADRCAVKIPFDPSPEARKRFDREVKVLRELPPNPHCVRYIADGEVQPGLPFLAMEFIDGITLHEAMRKQRVWPERDACEVMRQLCVAYAAQHRLGIANRDVKPENVMLTESHGAKVLDFGLVKDAHGLLRLFEEEDLYTGQRFAENIDRGVLAGSPDFMAPEQLTDSALHDAHKAQTDTWSDVYSLGLIFYRLLTGRRLYRFDAPRGASRTDYAKALLAYVRLRLEKRHEPVPRPAEIRPALWLVLEQALRADPRQRYRTAEAMGDDIVHFATHGQVSRQPDDVTSVADVGKFLAVHLQAGGAFGSSRGGKAKPSGHHDEFATKERASPRARRRKPPMQDGRAARPKAAPEISGGSAWSSTDPWAATEFAPEGASAFPEVDEELPTRIAPPKANRSLKASGRANPRPDSDNHETHEIPVRTASRAHAPANAHPHVAERPAVSARRPPSLPPPVPIEVQRTKPLPLPPEKRVPAEPILEQEIADEIITYVVPRARGRSAPDRREGWLGRWPGAAWPFVAATAVAVALASGLTWLLGIWR